MNIYLKRLEYSYLQVTTAAIITVLHTPCITLYLELIRMYIDHLGI